MNYKDFLFDIGGHRFFSKSKEVVDLWKEILPDDFISRPRMSRIYYDGKYYSYPLKAFEALTNLGPIESAMCVLSFMYKQAFPNEKPENFHEWVSNQFGERLFSIFFKTYTEKVWGMSCDEISADWAAQRIKGLDLWTAMASALRNSIAPAKKGPVRKADGEIIKTLIDSFEYPRRGPGMMWDAAAAKTRAQGGTIHMGTRARQARLGRRREALDRSPRDASDGATETFTANHVISSAPIRELVRLVRRAARPARRSAEQPALSRLHHRRADRREGRPVPRQLDLYPRARREGRPHPELPLVVAGDGARREARLPRPRILLLRGRRHLDRDRRRTDRPRQEGARADRPVHLERDQGRLRRAPEEGLSGL